MALIDYKFVVPTLHCTVLDLLLHGEAVLDEIPVIALQSLEAIDVQPEVLFQFGFKLAGLPQLSGEYHLLN